MASAPAVQNNPVVEEDAATRPLSLKLIRRIWSWTRPYAMMRGVLLFVVILRSVQLAVMADVLGWVIDDTLLHRDPTRLLWGTVGFLAIGLLTELNLHWRQLLALRLGEYVVTDLRQAIYNKLQTMTMGFYSTTKLGRIVSRMTSDAESVRVGVQDVMFVSLVCFGQMLMAAIFMLSLDWRLFLLVLGISPLIWLINQLFRVRFSTAFRNQQESYSRVTSSIAESVTGIRITQGFGRQEESAKNFAHLLQTHAINNLISARLRGIFMPLLDLNNQIFLALLLLVGGWLVLHHQMPLADIVRFFFLANVFFNPVRILGNQYASALTAMAGAERVFHLLDRRPEWEDAGPLKDIEKVQGEVQLEDVYFSYNKEKKVLQGISFSAKTGECIALVGHTGCGKSTIINLIARFYLADSGKITIDGQEIRGLNPDLLHRQMGIVLQVNFLFTGTVLDNIRLPKPEATEAEVRQVAEKLGCLDLFEGLTNGLHTLVGQGGSGLSLGQRQLICFCRAMLADPRILILDEATSAIDTITEARIQSAMEKLLTGRTSFIVAHRMSTIRHADQVLMLADGKIIERGRHRELLAAGGEYASAYRKFLKGDE